MLNIQRLLALQNKTKLLRLARLKANHRLRDDQLKPLVVRQVYNVRI